MTSSVENLHASLAKYSMENKKYSADQWRKEKEEKKLKQQREYYERNKEVLAQKARERMRLLRSKKKNATVAAVKTRTSAQKADDKRANRERNAASATKKKVLKQREKEREEKKRQQTRERVRKLRQNRKESSFAQPKPEVNITTPAFSSRMAKKRAKDKVSPALPQTPAKKAEILQNLASTPRTRKILEKKKFVRPVEEQQNIEAMECLVEDLAEGLSKVKKAKSTDERAAYNCTRSLAFGSSVKKNKHQTRIAKMMGVKRSQVSKAIKHRERVLKGDEACWLSTKRNVRCDAIKEEDKRVIYDFWTLQASRPTGSKRDKMRQRIGKKEYVEHAKHILEKTQTECFKEFQELHPDIKVKQRRFEQLKPFFVTGARERDRQSCLCRKHVECKIVFDSCMKYRKSIQNNEVQAFNFLTEAVESTLCEKPEDSSYSSLDCLTRSCDKCGVKNFKTAAEEMSETEVKWKRYEYITYKDNNGEEKRKIHLVQKETPVKEMFDYFQQLLKDYPYHSFMAKWQKEQFDHLMTNLPLNHIICVHDFSENYTCRSQDEIQSEYFDPVKVSIHVSIVYRHADIDIDGKASTEQDPVLIKEHIFALSEDNTQDYHFVHHTQGLILTYLRNEVKVKVDKVHEFTDGCAGQYKSKHTFGDLSCSLSDFGCQVDRHFFETSHAKGEQDAAGANVKQRATLAVIRREASIKSAKELYEYLKDKFSLPSSTNSKTTLNKRVYFYIPLNGEGAVDRNRIGRTFKELKGIRKIHSVKTTSQQCKVKTRLRSCMCIGCLTDMDCENEEYVDKWREVEMSREGDVAVTRQNQDSVNVSKTVNALTDLVEEGSTVAIAAADDAIYDYYLFKVTSSGAIILGEDEVDDYSAAYQKGSFVFKGNFFLRDNIIDMTYKLDNKQAIEYANTVRTICGELKKLNRRRNVLFQLLPNQHEEIMSSF